MFKLKMITLAVSAALTVPVMAEQTVDAAQTFFPQPGTVDRERNSSGVIGQIKADYAYGIGITGKGVTIGLLDTGLNIANSEFQEAGKLAKGYNALTGGTIIADGNGHGTFVAGIIGASRNGLGMFGVAYDAQLLPIKALTDTGSGPSSSIDTGLRYAAGKTSIVNMSFGAPSSFDSSSLQQAVKSGLLIVAAAGNSGGANPEWPARFAKETWANNQIIAVGAVDSKNIIASFSNRAGDTAPWFLVAPGVKIPSAYQNGYAYMSGTSVSTPVVSGAAALIKQMWPSMRADQIASVLFITATDLGAAGIDPIYGRGLVNVEKALQPVGTVTSTLWNGKTIKLLNTSVTPTSATSKLWALAASGDLRVVGLDDFNRDFNINLGAAITKPAGMTLDQTFAAVDRRIEVAESVLADGSRYSVVYIRNARVADGSTSGLVAAQENKLAALSYVQKNMDGSETALGTGGLASYYFGAGGFQLDNSVALGSIPALTNPYFSLVPGATYGAVSHQLGNNANVKIGLMTSGLDQVIASQWGIAQGEKPRANAFLVEISKTFGAASLSMILSRTNESGAYLGAQSQGALLLSTKNSTSAVQFTAALQLAPKIALAGQVAFSRTPGNSGGDGLMVNMDGTKTNAFSLALVEADRFWKGDRISFSVAQPIRAYSGDFTLDVVSSVNSAGNAVRERRSFSLVPTGRELLADVSYLAPVGKDASVGLTLALRHHPNNFSDAPTERLLAVRFIKRF